MNRAARPWRTRTAALLVVCTLAGGGWSHHAEEIRPPGAAAIPIFVDVTERAGIDFRHSHGASGQRYLPETMGGGGCALDFDGDGKMDLFWVQSGQLVGAIPQAVGHRLFRNRGDGTFADVTRAAGIAAIPTRRGYGQGAVCADIDGDHDPDIYITALGPNLLLRNQGDGTFSEVAAELGIDDPAWSSSAAFFDADGDSDLDLYVVNYLDWTVENHRECRFARADLVQYCHPDVYPMAADHFYRQRTDGTFALADESAGLVDQTGKGLGVVVTDFDNDSRPDLYVTNDSTPNFFYRNLGQGKFAEEGLLRGAAFNEFGQTEAGMGVAAGDVNGDGFFDLLVTNLSLESNALYLGGPAGFTYATRQAGLHGPSLMVLGFGTDWLDLDHDGDLDLVVINGDVLDNVEQIHDGLTFRQPGQIFLNDGRGRFTELPAAQVGDLAVPRVGRGSIVLDFDDDGRLDLAVAYNHDRARLFHHQGEVGQWIGFRLRGAGKNTGAIGARVVVFAAGRQQLEEVRAGSSYLTSSDPRLHFGLGAADHVDRVVIHWPDGQTTELRNLAAGRYHSLAESN